MAQAAYLILKIGGTVIEGESTVTSQGREGTIECLSFRFSVETLVDRDSQRVAGKRQYTPVVIRKRIDKSTPLILKGLARNEVIEAEFRFFHVNEAGDEEYFYKVAISNARIVRVEQLNDALDGNLSALPAIEDVAFAYSTISLQHLAGGTEYQDSNR